MPNRGVRHGEPPHGCAIRKGERAQGVCVSGAVLLYNPDNLPQILLPFGEVSLLTWRGILVAADREGPSFKEWEEEE